MSEIQNKIGTINVVSQQEAYSMHSQYDAVITIEDPNSYGFRVKNNMPQLVLQFHDIDKVMRNYDAPAISHIQEAIDFARKYQDAKLLIHCAMGISRSPATALAIIADRLGKDNEQEAIEYLYSTFPNIDPNERVVRIADNILDLDRQLIGSFRKKKASLAPAQETNNKTTRFTW